MTVPLDIMSLKGKTVATALRGVVTSPPQVDQSIEVAGQITVTVSDPQRRMTDTGGLLNDTPSGLLATAPILTYGNARYPLAAMSKVGDTYTLAFEDQVPDWLRQYRSYIKATRKQTPDGPGVTAAEFLARLVREPMKHGRQIALRCPELHEFQPPLVEAAAAGSGQDASLAAGLTPGAKLTVKGKAATAAQTQVMSEAFAAVRSPGAPRLALIALFEAGTTENEWSTGQGRGADAISSGFLQLVRSLHGTMTTAQAAKKFMTTGFAGRGGAIALAKAHPDWKPHQVAQAVQGSGAGRASDGAANYGPWQQEAIANLSAFGIGAGDAISGASDAIEQDYEFTRGQPGEPESSWAAAVRIADERNWRWFAVQNLLTYASEPRLLEQQARASISEYDHGVGEINYDWRPRARVNTLTTTLRMQPNYIVPGQVLHVTDPGPVNGRWLVTRVTQAGDSNIASIEARQPQSPKREPASSTAAAATDGAATGTGEGTDAVFAKAKEIGSKNYPYVYGGGHGTKPGVPSGSPKPGFDCSSYVCACLAAGGFIDTVKVSGDLAASFGQPGRGQEFTVWANAEHVFLEFHGANQGYRADTSPHGGTPATPGPQLRKGTRSTSGFTARHVEGH